MATGDSISTNGEFNLLDRRDHFGIGVHDGLSARLATRGKFDFLWLGSFSVSMASGVPDAGLIDPSELVRHLQIVRQSSDLPVVVDLDSGHGHPAKVAHVVRGMAAAGAAAVCIEDNPVEKYSSLYPIVDRRLVEPEVHAERIRAALAATGGRCPVIARTEALVAGRGVEEAWSRTSCYVEAGAAAVFVQTCDRTGSDLKAFLHRWDRRTPVFLAPTLCVDVAPAAFLADGATHIIFANQLVRVAHASMMRAVQLLSESRDPRALAEMGISSIEDLSSTVDVASTIPGSPRGR